MERFNTEAAQKAKKIIADKKAAEKDAEDRKAAEQFLEALGTITLYPYGIMLLWNWILPSLFGLPPISFLQSLGLLIMSRILIKR